ncbi:rRNA maturation RNase YbeY [Halpernia humi]|uniref:Endoribonuclease YbeY n=1 Tax=Halpernia humi TaxID=493375 RepID=A0A1H5Y451_9FLAO|nr:rRNA maturation RNase YbeY [Halpernia humi]SEG18733.1 rRNA maturation RNase YbeY [Halpernia humi]
MINYFFENIEKIEISSKISPWLEQIILTENKKTGDINYIFADDAYILKINQDYLKHDYYTDIITFDYVKGKTISGDIFVSLPRISDNAKMLNKDLEREFLRVLAHGILHLCGYKDKSKEEISVMRDKEDFYINIF